MLYLLDQNPDADKDRVQIELRKQFTEEPLRQFVWSLISGVIASRDALDDVHLPHGNELATGSHGSPTDRNVLRMGLYEMTRDWERQRRL
jgi:transcription termination factor NusB